MVRDLSATTTASTSASSGVGRHSDGLHHAHAGAHEVVGEVGRAGEIVGDAAEH
jgi:hypothetical protein